MKEELYTVRCTEDDCSYGEFNSRIEAQEIANEFRQQAKEQEGEYSTKFYYVEPI